MLLVTNYQLALLIDGDVTEFVLEGVLNHLTEDSPMTQKYVMVIFKVIKVKLIFVEQCVLVFFVEYSDDDLLVFCEQLDLNAIGLFIYFVLAILSLHLKFKILL